MAEDKEDSASEQAEDSTTADANRDSSTTASKSIKTSVKTNTTQPSTIRSDHKIFPHEDTDKKIVQNKPQVSEPEFKDEDRDPSQDLDQDLDSDNRDKEMSDTDQRDDEMQDKEDEACEARFVANEDGLVVIEAENTLMEGKWKVHTGEVPGASGNQVVSYIRGISPTDPNHSKDPHSVLTYTIYIDTPGNYVLSALGGRYNGNGQIQKMCPGHDNKCCARTSKRAMTCSQADLNNDSFYTVIDPDGKALVKDVKGYVSIGNKLNTLVHKLTFEQNHKKFTPVLNFSKSGVYQLKVGGRSTYFMLDKIFLQRQKAPAFDVAATETLCREEV